MKRIIFLLICYGNAYTQSVTITGGLRLDSFVQRHYVIEGDSFSDGALDWPNYLPDYSPFFGLAKQVNFAKSGGYARDMVTEYNTQAHTARPSRRGDDYWFFLYAGINDLSSLSASAQTVYNYLRTIWKSAKDDGYTVVAYTVISSLYLSAAKEAQRDSLNKLIIGSKDRYCDYVIDVARYLNPRVDYSYFKDSTHLNDAGNRKFAYLTADTIKHYVFPKY